MEDVPSAEMRTLIRIGRDAFYDLVGDIKDYLPIANRVGAFTAEKRVRVFRNRIYYIELINFFPAFRYLQRCVFLPVAVIWQISLCMGVCTIPVQVDVCATSWRR